MLGQSFGVAGGISLSSRAQMMRTGPRNKRCCSAHLSNSPFGVRFEGI